MFNSTSAPPLQSPFVFNEEWNAYSPDLGLVGWGIIMMIARSKASMSNPMIQKCEFLLFYKSMHTNTKYKTAHLVFLILILILILKTQYTLSSATTTLFVKVKSISITLFFSLCNILFSYLHSHTQQQTNANVVMKLLNLFMYVIIIINIIS